MSRDGGSYYVDFSGSPVNVWVVFGQPGVSQNNVILFAKIQYEEVLCRIPSINSEMEFDLVVDHPSLVVGSISVLGIHGLSKSFQRPIHSPSKVEINATDSCPTVN